MFSRGPRPDYGKLARWSKSVEITYTYIYILVQNKVWPRKVWHQTQARLGANQSVAGGWAVRIYKRIYKHIYIYIYIYIYTGIYIYLSYILTHLYRYIYLSLYKSIYVYIYISIYKLYRYATFLMFGPPKQLTITPPTEI